jgi:hypothetical protein
MKKLCTLTLALFFVQTCICRPQKATTLVTTTTPSSTTTFAKVDASDESDDNDSAAVITEFHVRSDIQFRYARTIAESYVKNPDSVAREVTFEIVLPDSAFGKSYIFSFSFHQLLIIL